MRAPTILSPAPTAPPCCPALAARTRAHAVALAVVAPCTRQTSDKARGHARSGNERRKTRARVLSCGAASRDHCHRCCGGCCRDRQALSLAAARCAGGVTHAQDAAFVVAFCFLPSCCCSHVSPPGADTPLPCCLDRPAASAAARGGQDHVSECVDQHVLLAPALWVQPHRGRHRGQLAARAGGG